jgi:hypothetical protein
VRVGVRFVGPRLSLCKVSQDGDDEGCLRLMDLPTPEQALLIRKALGLNLKRTANVGSFKSAAQEGFNGPKSREKETPGTVPPADTGADFSAENEPPAEAAE